jgi:hypothetical protein
MKHEAFKAMAQDSVDYSVDVISIKNMVDETMMCVCSEEAAIYVTKEQAMKFFGLVEAPVDEQAEQAQEDYDNAIAERESCPVIGKHCDNYYYQRDSNGEVVTQYCSHWGNCSNYEGNCTSDLCPLNKGEQR